MRDSQSAGAIPLVSRNAAGEALSRALRLYVGRGRRYSCKEVERGSGVAARMVESYLCDPSQEDWRPAKLAEVLSLARFLGPDFTAQWLSLADQGAFWLPDEEPDPGVLAADNADDNAIVTRAAADRQFDEDERPDLHVVGRRMVSRGAQLAALGHKPMARAA